MKPKSRWIKAISSDLPKDVFTKYPTKYIRYCALCKSRMEFKEENDAWICLNTKCLAYLPRGYGIGPIKGEQEELVTITDPYGDLQKPFAKRININRGTIWTENQLKRPVTEKHKIVSHPNKPAAAEESDR